MTEPTTAPTQTGLTIQDLTLTLQVIQVATSRGVFKADELTTIGGLYDRIFKFLEATGAIKTEPAPAPAEQEPAAPVVTETTPKGRKAKAQ